MRINRILNSAVCKTEKIKEAVMMINQEETFGMDEIKMEVDDESGLPKPIETIG